MLFRSVDSKGKDRSEFTLKSEPDLVNEVHKPLAEAPASVPLKSDEGKTVESTVVDEKRLAEIRERRLALTKKNKELRQYKAELLFVDKEKGAVCLPSGFLDMSGLEIPVLILSELCELTETQIFEFPSEQRLMTIEGSNDFLIGFLLGIQDTRPTKLSSKKVGIELGRACAFAMKVKAEFELMGIVSLLAPNQFFFGNSPMTATKENVKVPFAPKITIEGQYKNAKMGERMWNTLHYLFGKLGLSQYDEEGAKEIVNLHMLKFDDVANSCLPAIRSTARKNKGEIIGRRKPKIPATSPLLLPCELSLIRKLAKPLWGSMSVLKENWIATASALGPGPSKDRIREIYRSRWKLIEAFANLTTKRLKTVRAQINDVKLTKAKVSIDQLRHMLEVRTNPVEEFYEELHVIFGSSWKKVQELAALSLEFSNNESYPEIIKQRIVDSYRTIFGADFQDEWDAVYTADSAFEAEFKGVYNALKGLCTKSLEVERCYTRSEKIENPVHRQHVMQNALKIVPGFIADLGHVGNSNEAQIKLALDFMNFSSTTTAAFTEVIGRINAAGLGTLIQGVETGPGQLKADAQERLSKAMFGFRSSCVQLVEILKNTRFAI